MIKSFLFDLDDTIISREKAFDGTLKSLIAEWFNSYSESEKNNLFTVLKNWDERGLVDRPIYLQKILNNYQNIDKNLNELTKFYWKSFVESVIPDKKANQFLQELNEKNISWGIVTNGDENQYSKIEKAELTEICPFVVVSDIFGTRKPNQEIFEYALKKLGSKKEETLFVGDTIETDIIGAQNFGMKSAWIHHNRVWPTYMNSPEMIISHITDLNILLE
ncbi:MAG: hypothetical protein CL764_00790 [Chloroflexi bacterium]|nr:hypothetical protein [Chloroflexota bacterium]|tara:strand:+ start:12491 stop:13150 length:660 start_codon:yes stop_codon:yes gene_type:complete